jgi:hypothetical protein
MIKVELLNAQYVNPHPPAGTFSQIGRRIHIQTSYCLFRYHSVKVFANTNKLLILDSRRINAIF